MSEQEPNVTSPAARVLVMVNQLQVAEGNAILLPFYRGIFGLPHGNSADILPMLVQFQAHVRDVRRRSEALNSRMATVALKSYGQIDYIAENCWRLDWNIGSLRSELKGEGVQALELLDTLLQDNDPDPAPYTGDEINEIVRIASELRDQVESAADLDPRVRALILERVDEIFRIVATGMGVVGRGAIRRTVDALVGAIVSRAGVAEALADSAAARYIWASVTLLAAAAGAGLLGHHFLEGNLKRPRFDAASF